jgi:hypothetical protein
MTYVEGLEKRVKMCTSENAQLKKKVDGLEQQNQYVDLVSYQITEIQHLTKLLNYRNTTSHETIKLQKYNVSRNY